MTGEILNISIQPKRSPIFIIQTRDHAGDWNDKAIASVEGKPFDEVLESFRSIAVTFGHVRLVSVIMEKTPTVEEVKKN